MGKHTTGGGRRVVSARATTAQGDLGDIKNLPELSDRNSLLHDVGMFLDGERIKIPGFSGIVKYTVISPPGRRATQTIMLQPDYPTRNSQAYRREKDRLGDDYDIDLTGNSRLMQIAQEKGYKYGAGNKRDTISKQMTRSGILRGRG